MRGSSQKAKLSRRPSANSREGSASSAADKQDRLQELRAKIEKERDAMRRTGKRFSKNTGTPASESRVSPEQPVEEVPLPPGKTVTPFFKRESKVAESTATEGPSAKQETTAVESRPAQRSNVKLADLMGAQSSSESACLSSSRVFEKEVVQQKTRNMQIRRFLEGIGLGEYAEGLINMGYDELDVLVEVKAEELNFLMMRAGQQRRLSEALDALRLRSGAVKDDRNESLMGLPSFFKARAGMKAPPKKQQQQRMQTEPNLASSRPKSALTSTSTVPTNNSQLFGGCAFFCGIGGNDWSMDSLVRRACSGCFRVFPSSELEQRSECYYCRACSKVEDDVIGLTLSASMRRDYQPHASRHLE